jgi:hypothetical protein
VNVLSGGLRQRVAPGSHFKPRIACQGTSRRSFFPRVPIIQGEILRGKGLFDLTCPKLEIACCSVLKPSGWVRQTLTPAEVLRVFDVRAALVPPLLQDRHTCSLLFCSLSPLLISSVFRAMWAGVGGGSRGACPVKEVRLRSKVDTDLHIDASGVGREMERREEENCFDGNGQVDMEGKCSFFDDSSTDLLKCRGSKSDGPEPSLDTIEPSRPAVQATMDPPLVLTLSSEAKKTMFKKLKKEHVLAKAVKANNAKVPVYIWDEVVCRRRPSEKETRALTTLRLFFLGQYRWRLWQVLRNLVETVEEEVSKGYLKDGKLWLFTNNSTAESCFYRGGSSLKLLHELVLKLRKAEIWHGFVLQVDHVAGTRMIAQGTDGLSRGSFLEGVLAGKDMLSFVDQSLSTVRRHPKVLVFVQSWMKPAIGEGRVLREEEWFVEGHGIIGERKDGHRIWIPMHVKNGRAYIWSPPPVIVDVALEECMKAVHKRTDAYHVFLILRL